MKTDVEFWAKVNPVTSDGCWEWQGAKTSAGYGCLSWNGKTAVAHRVAAYLHGLVGTVAAPTDKKSDGFVLHQCDNRKCCNPTHFRLGTFSQNQKESYDRKRREQPKGDKHANAKLTAEQAETIRTRYASGEKQVPLSQEYGVTQRVISLIIREKSYNDNNRF